MLVVILVKFILFYLFLYVPFFFNPFFLSPNPLFSQGVPIFTPNLPSCPDFKLDDDFREFIFTKLINAERFSLPSLPLFPLLLPFPSLPFFPITFSSPINRGSYHCSGKVRRQKRTLFQIMKATRKGYFLSSLFSFPLFLTPQHQQVNWNIVFLLKTKNHSKLIILAKNMVVVFSLGENSVAF